MGAGERPWFVVRTGWLVERSGKLCRVSESEERKRFLRLMLSDTYCWWTLDSIRPGF